MAEESGRARRLHAFRVSAKQRLHLAALLIIIAATPLFAQSASQGSDDISFDPAITQQEFAEFSRLVAQGIYATPVEPARARGILGFDIGIAATAIPVDTNAAYWTRSVSNDFTVSDHIAVPRLVASKGFSAGTVTASWARVPDSDIEMWGGTVDFPIVSGGIATPTLALRGAYSWLKGVEQYDLKTYGVELFLSKGFGPITPYVAAGKARSNAEAHIAMPDATTMTLTDRANTTRYTAGVKLSLLVPKIIVEATQAEERSYAAKIAFGF